VYSLPLFLLRISPKFLAFMRLKMKQLYVSV